MHGEDAPGTRNGVSGHGAMPPLASGATVLPSPVAVTAKVALD